MTFLLFSIICNVLFGVVFRLYLKYNISTLHAIVYNYITAAILSFVFIPAPTNSLHLFTEPWHFLCFGLGSLFIVVFYAVAINMQTTGIVPTTIAYKMSVVIPVAAAFILYDDKITISKIAGIITALPAIYFSSTLKTSEGAWLKEHFKKMLPLVFIFFGSGTIDSLINLIQQKYISPNEMNTFLFIAFTAPSVIGILLLIKQKNISNILALKNILGGSILGIINYLSIQFMVLGLDSKNLDNSSFFVLNNLGIIIISALISNYFFNEKLTVKNYLGLALALLSIVLIFI